MASLLKLDGPRTTEDGRWKAQASVTDMNIHETTRSDTGEPKTLKVCLPTALHIQLHRLKILTGKSISEAVGDALRTYFRDMQQGRVVAGAAADASAGSLAIREPMDRIDDARLA